MESDNPRPKGRRVTARTTQVLSPFLMAIAAYILLVRQQVLLAFLIAIVAGPVCTIVFRVVTAPERRRARLQRG